MHFDKHSTRTFKFGRLAAIFLIVLLGVAAPRQAARSQGQQGGKPVEVIITLRDQARLPQGGIQRKDANRGQRISEMVGVLRQKTAATQPALMKSLRKLQVEGKVERIQSLWMINAVAVTASPEVLDELSRLTEVASVTPDYPLVVSGAAPDLSAATITGMVENLAQIRAPYVWATGHKGRGVVVANLDTGVSLENTDLAARWRGGSNSWYDVHGEHDTPVDLTSGYTGHGTGTMSIMLGKDTGVAPHATWVAVKLFSDSGGASFSDAILGFEWLLDPDGDPETDDAPHVINNSWTMPYTGCVEDPNMHLALQNLLAANIVPVFAAGNYGYAGEYSDTSPGNYIESLAVGSIDFDMNLSYFSSQGPTTCRGGVQTFPDLVAPGSDVPLQTVIGTRTYNQGTSFAAPHVAGALALLLDAFPGLTAEQQRQALVNSTSDLGLSGIDNSFGSGYLDVYAAYLSLGGTPPHMTPVLPIRH